MLHSFAPSVLLLTDSLLKAAKPRNCLLVNLHSTSAHPQQPLARSCTYMTATLPATQVLHLSGAAKKGTIKQLQLITAVENMSNICSC
jgi:hypothetical protein